MRLLLGCKMVQQKDSQNKRHGILQDYSAGCSSFDDLRQTYNRNVAKTSNKLLSCTIYILSVDSLFALFIWVCGQAEILESVFPSKPIII